MSKLVNKYYFNSGKAAQILLVILQEKQRWKDLQFKWFGQEGEKVS